MRRQLDAPNLCATEIRQEQHKFSIFCINEPSAVEQQIRKLILTEALGDVVLLVRYSRECCLLHQLHSAKPQNFSRYLTVLSEVSQLDWKRTLWFLTAKLMPSFRTSNIIYWKNMHSCNTRDFSDMSFYIVQTLWNQLRWANVRLSYEFDAVTSAEARLTTRLAGTAAQRSCGPSCRWRLLWRDEDRELSRCWRQLCRLCSQAQRSSTASQSDPCLESIDKLPRLCINTQFLGLHVYDV